MNFNIFYINNLFKFVILLKNMEKFEKTLNDFYSMKLDVFQFFPTISSQKSEGSDKKMNVLLLGSYRPGIMKLMKQYECGRTKPNKRLKKDKKLCPTEKILLVKRALEYMGYEVLLGNDDKRETRNVWNRLGSLLNQADHITVLLKNQGGVLIEYTRILSDEELRKKTVCYIEEGEKLSGVLESGGFLLPNAKVVYYKGNRDLADTVVRTAEAYNHEFFKS